MDAMLWVGLAAGVCLVTVLLGCLRCRRKLTDDEVQRKDFEKFRKRHMLYRDRILSKDYIHCVMEEQSAACVTGVSDHTYDDVHTPPVPHPLHIHVDDASPAYGSNHSFFDDSFQTVVEASSMSNVDHGMPNLLTVPSQVLASYLSLQKSSQTSLRGEHLVGEGHISNEGEINQVFSGNSTNSTTSGSNCGSTDSINYSYVVPNCGPKIRIMQPSLKRKVDESVPVINAQIDQQLPVHSRRNSRYGWSQCRDSVFDSDEQLTEEDVGNGNGINENPDSSEEFHGNGINENPGCSEELHGNGINENFDSREEFHGNGINENLDSREEFQGNGIIVNLDISEDFNDKGVNEILNSREKFHRRSLRKLVMEGCTHYNEKTLSADDEAYEMLRASRTERYMYRSLHKTALVLPGRPRVCTPVRLACTEPVKSRQVQSSSGSCHSNHTYESITCDLASEINTRDSVSDYDLEGNKSLRTNPGRILHTPAHRGSYTDERNDLDRSCKHDYESIRSHPTSVSDQTNIACENSAVIIGRRVSNPFDPTKLSKRLINKKKLKSLKNNLDQSGKNMPKDDEDRYSPFPSAKKLAFKSAFNQMTTPRFSMIQTIAGNIIQVGNQPGMCLDNLNIRTPEIKVENCAQFFDNTEFVSPFILKENDRDCEKAGVDLISPMYTHEMQKGNIDLIAPMNTHDTLKGTIDLISPVFTNQTLRNCLKLQVNNTNLQACLMEKPRQYKTSLPSLSDHPEEEFMNHCNVNTYSRSTPEQQQCNYF